MPFHSFWVCRRCLVSLHLPTHRPNPCLHHHRGSFLPLFSWYKDTGHGGLGFTLIKYDLILMWLHQQRPHFWIRSHSQVPGIRTLISLFGGRQCNRQHLDMVATANWTREGCLAHSQPLCKMTSDKSLVQWETDYLGSNPSSYYPRLFKWLS